MTIETLLLQSIAFTATTMLALCYIEKKIKKNAKDA